ncbi:hypothetical protein SS37A_24950 [Methylocystis iwaonis]|uniref:Uncharacterized protein n=1 Tax=Methylocystis iwaonis TaxID=2885079 RepID=A0ABN6VJG4_9HYPH|nr:hypothetical protein SS37A_24950 [Methylocystis iwaonis]
MGQAPHRKAAYAKSKMGRKLRERTRRGVAAGQRIRDNAYAMAVLRLRAREVGDMPEQAADRRAHYMQNAQRLMSIHIVSQGATTALSVRKFVL